MEADSSFVTERTSALDLKVVWAIEEEMDKQRKEQKMKKVIEVAMRNVVCLCNAVRFDTSHGWFI